MHRKRAAPRTRIDVAGKHIGLDKCFLKLVHAHTFNIRDVLGWLAREQSGEFAANLNEVLYDAAMFRFLRMDLSSGP